MSKSKPIAKRPIAAAAPTQAPRKTAPVPKKTFGPKQEMVFGRQNYILFIAGAVLIFIGLALMTGGQMPSPDVWDDNIIYSFRRVTLAPILILAGLAVEVVAIFKK